VAKDVLEVNAWEGGLNNASAGTDIADNELKLANDADVTKIGIIRLSGNCNNAVTDNPPTVNATGSFAPGRGLFAFSNDRDSDGTLVSANFYAMQNDNKINMWDSNDDAWDDDEITIGSDTGDCEANFLFHDGILRVCDGNLTNTNNVRNWWGYMSRTHFPGTKADGYTGMFEHDADLSAPTRGLVGPEMSGTGQASSATALTATDSAAWTNATIEVAAANSASKQYIALNEVENSAETVSAVASATVLTTSTCTDWNTDAYSVFPSAGEGITLQVQVATSGGAIGAGTYEFACSFVYDGLQESIVKVMGGGNGGDYVLTGTTNKFQNIHLRATSPYNGRISGVRVYIRDSSTHTELWTLFQDVDFTLGSRTSLDASFKYSTTTVFESEDSGISTIYQRHTCADVTALGTQTYFGINGYKSDANIDCAYKSAVTVGGITYAGNVRQNSVNYPDRMLKCASVFQGVASDVFPDNNFIDIATGDGDAIIKLATYADRVLVFKERHLYIVNYSEAQGDYLEADYPYLGITHPAHSFATPHGIAWMNSAGVHLYNGEDVTTLTSRQKATEGEGVGQARKVGAIGTASRKIDWDSFFSTTKYPSLGYNPISDQLIVLQGTDYSADNTPDALVFDMTSGGWTTPINPLGGVATVDASNFVINSDGELVLTYSKSTTVFKKWDADPKASTTFDIKTKDFDFGAPSQNKRLYKVLVSAKGSDASDVRAELACDGRAYANVFTDQILDDNASFFTDNELVITTVSECRYASLRLYANAQVSTDFEINDISFVYRLLPPR